MDFLRRRSLLSFNLYSYLLSKCGITHKFIHRFHRKRTHAHTMRRDPRGKSEKRITINTNRCCYDDNNKNKKPMKLKSHIVKCRGEKRPSAKFIKFDEIFLLLRLLFLVRFGFVLYLFGFYWFHRQKGKVIFKLKRNGEKNICEKSRFIMGQPLSKCF